MERERKEVSHHNLSSISPKPELEDDRFAYPPSVVSLNLSQEIDLFSPDYYEQMLLIRKEIAERQSVVPSILHQLQESSPHRTDGITTDTHAILTNVCFDKQWRIHLFNNSDIVRSGQSKLRANDFYYNQAIVHPSCFNDSLPLGAYHNMIITHTRSNHNIFHILESQGVLVKLALHPELFPSIHYFVFASFSFKSAWWSLLNKLILDLFDPSRRPTIIDPWRRSGVKNLYCDRSLTLLRTWDSRGSGMFIGEKLGVDMLRAAAYHYANVHPQRERTQLHVLAIQRKGKRKIVNFDTLVKEMSKIEETTLRKVMLEELSPVEQVSLFADTDVIVSPHGAGLTNVIFMLPRSGVVELFPPNFVFFCYKRMCESADILYLHVKGVPATPPPCVNKKQCVFETMRDVDFAVFVNQTVAATRNMIDLVKVHKYAS
ncbi:hypothetical protein WA588_003921, partial [Blastocystis sp. NMH]